VDATHSGSTHAATQAAAEATAAAALAAHAARVWVATPADTAINDTNDVTIVTHDMTSIAAGDQIIVDAWFVVLNNSTATRNIIVTLDFDALFDVELTMPAVATSATLLHPARIRGVLDVRSTSLAYGMMFLDMQLAAGIASGTDTSAAATHLAAKGWGTSGSNATGTVTVALKARSANNTATQTFRLHSLTMERLTPG
jgi:hypothetical protein